VGPGTPGPPGGGVGRPGAGLPGEGSPGAGDGPGPGACACAGTAASPLVPSEAKRPIAAIPMMIRSERFMRRSKSNRHAPER
jgi:hypothetical protein